MVLYQQEGKIRDKKEREELLLVQDVTVTERKENGLIPLSQRLLPK